MKWSGKLLAAIFTLLASVVGQAQTIMPQPLTWSTDEGILDIKNEIGITYDDDLESEAQYLMTLIEKWYPSEIYLCGTRSCNNLNITEFSLSRLKYHNDQLDKEGYELHIKKKGIDITANTDQGIMHGIQSLRQLMIQTQLDQKNELPYLKISDHPKFKHRGLLLDCARHFFSVEVLKKYIDLLALYKMNTLHWHLTEDQGWRIAIDAYPKLEETSAWRTEDNGLRYGGYYSKEDIEEVVAYASERHVQIIPEIEMPGHSLAALAAYPELSCTGGPFEVGTEWGVYKDIYCAGNEETFTFLEKVLDEVIELFPSPYIHIGGDEAPTYNWERCSKCQKRIADEGLKNEHELQGYFIKRMEKYLQKHGKQIIGWDEILEGGISNQAIVQSWRGMEGGIEAAKHGNQAIMSPVSHCYLDYDLTAIDLERVYSFDPIPEELSLEQQKYIIGGEVNMWTERVPHDDNLDSKVFPRLMAMSEVVWSYPTERNYNAFFNRVQEQYPILNEFDIKYGPENNAGKITHTTTKNNIEVKLTPGNTLLNLQYAVNNDSFQSYSTPISLNEDATIKLQAYKEDDKYGEPIEQSYKYHKALAADIDYVVNANKWYLGGGPKGLVDGAVGSLRFNDGKWQGYWGKDLDVTIDIGKTEEISYLGMNCYQYINSWIFAPTFVEYYISEDGKNFELVHTEHSPLSEKEKGNLIVTIDQTFSSKKARYIRVFAKNKGKNPEWHDAAGADAWLFVDEIVVK